MGGGKESVYVRIELCAFMSVCMCARVGACQWVIGWESGREGGRWGVLVGESLTHAGHALAALVTPQYKLPGHAGSVNDCAFHPKQPIIASASSDSTLYLGELMQ